MEEDMDGLVQDARYALRTLRKSPAFVTTTVLILSLGINAHLAIIAVVNAVLLQPLPVREPERILRVFDDLRGAVAKNVGLSVPALHGLSERSGVFERISAAFPSSPGWGAPALAATARRPTRVSPLQALK
jgi:putative ABC transport system permease protein